MILTEIRLHQLREAPWNSNCMDAAMLTHLKESIRRYNVVENLVVRPVGPDNYEVLSGNQRLRALTESGFESAPCVVVAVDDANARLLADALNHVRGTDNLGLRAEMMRKVLATVLEKDVLALLPETVDSLQSLASLGTLTMADSLREWQQGRGSRLHRLGFQLTTSQLAVVEEALSCLMTRAAGATGENPNLRGIALYLLCKDYIEGKEQGK